MMPRIERTTLTDFETTEFLDQEVKDAFGKQEAKVYKNSDNIQFVLINGGKANECASARSVQSPA